MHDDKVLTVKEGETTDEVILKDLQDYPYEMLYDADAWVSMAKTLEISFQILDEASKQAQRELITASHRAANGEGPQVDIVEVSKRLNVYRVSQMLAQMEIENRLKGLIVHSGREAPNTHDLLRLADEAGLVLSENEKTTLTVLNRMNQLGRYRVGGNEKKGFSHGVVAFNYLDKSLAPIRTKIASQFAAISEQRRGHGS